MTVKELLPGHKVDIRVLQEVNRKDGEEVVTYMSSIFDTTPTGEVLINMPTNAGKIVVLSMDLRYEFIFNCTGNMYKAEGVVSGRAKKENFYLLRIKLTTPLVKFQRRQYYRLETMMPLMYLAIDEETALQENLEEVKQSVKATALSEETATGVGFVSRGMGTIMDISGGGIRFINENKLEDVEYMLMQFQFENEDGSVNYMSVVAKKIASEYKELAGKYEHRTRFLFKDEKARERLIKYIFDEERRLRKKVQG